LDGFPELLRELEHGHKFFVSPSGTDWFYEYVNYSSTYPYKNVRETLVKNPIVITHSDNEALNVANQGDGMVFIMDDDKMNVMAKSMCALVPMYEPVSGIFLFYDECHKFNNYKK
jgi:hypothetical protein